MAGMYMDHGLAPVAGGVLDQAANFVTAARFAAGEKQYWKSELKLT